MEKSPLAYGEINEISMAIFNSFLYVYQRANLHFPMVFPLKHTWKHQWPTAGSFLTPVPCVPPRGQVLGVSNRCHDLLGSSADAIHRADAIVNRHGLADDFFQMSDENHPEMMILIFIL